MSLNNLRPMLTVFLVCGIFLLSGVVAYTYHILKNPDQELVTRNGERQIKAESWDDIIQYDGKTYHRKNNIKSVLFMGVDNADLVHEKGMVGNMGRTDSLVLFILDTESKKIRILQISRDTIVPVDVYDTNGDFVYTGNMQINMQYSFGDGLEQSCLLTVQRVEDLLYGTPIYGYAMLTLDGIPKIVDDLGGINVSLQQDYTQINESYTAGSTILMKGTQIEEFVRYRDTEVSGSNEGRMERHTIFFKALQRKLQEMDSDGNVLIQLQKKYKEDMMIEISSEVLLDLSGYTLEEEAYKLPGTNRLGDVYDEFHLNESALKELIIQLFYEL